MSFCPVCAPVTGQARSVSGGVSLLWVPWSLPGPQDTAMCWGCSGVRGRGLGPSPGPYLPCALGWVALSPALEPQFPISEVDPGQLRVGALNGDCPKVPKSPEGPTDWRP